MPTTAHFNKIALNLEVDTADVPNIGDSKLFPINFAILDYGSMSGVTLNPNETRFFTNTKDAVQLSPTDDGSATLIDSDADVPSGTDASRLSDLLPSESEFISLEPGVMPPATSRDLLKHMIDFNILKKVFAPEKGIDYNTQEFSTLTSSFSMDTQVWIPMNLRLRQKKNSVKDDLSRMVSQTIYFNILLVSNSGMMLMFLVVPHLLHMRMV